MRFHIKTAFFFFIITNAIPVMANSSDLASVSAGKSSSLVTESRQSPLTGAWKMVKFEAGTADELKTIPYSGQLIITNAGTLSAQAMNPDRTVPDTAYTVNGYEALYGEINIDDASGRFIVTVVSSLARELIGKKMERAFIVTGNKLVLSPVDKSEGWRVTYERY
ncbi:lipocalin-like domain-containing protein [Pantoea agglomerans]|uniref:lipocalin-like domain-containing protein n=1 Tax=Enterobacter agglomerans TaxID=549 RepID=UPI0017852876|nr:lipocalin-like domain-containing protein [Pantoea agglomerans]MBD8133770.1 lipocalin-like domain-containing protein [Pantoea agglomerans]